MISDAERREVAATMRATALRGVRGLTLGEVLNSILTGGAPRPTTEMAILANLADLIDRPTCKFKPAYGPDLMGEVSLVECTACAWTIEPWIAYEFHYCPMCGAEVVRDGD